MLKSGIISVALLSAFSSFAVDIPVTLVDGDWANAVASPSGGTITIANSGISGGKSTARWGTSTGAGQSGYDFESAVTPFNAQTDGTPFLLGNFTHFNFPITGTSLDTIDLNLILGNVFNVATTFNIDHDETPNTNIPPDDIVTIQNPIANQLFSYSGNDYFFNLIGFSTDGGSTIKTKYFTKEGEENVAGLYGMITTERVTVPDSAPSMAMLGLTLLGFGAVRRKLK